MYNLCTVLHSNAKLFWADVVYFGNHKFDPCRYRREEVMIRDVKCVANKVSCERRIVSIAPEVLTQHTKLIRITVPLWPLVLCHFSISPKSGHLSWPLFVAINQVRSRTIDRSMSISHVRFGNRLIDKSLNR